VVRVGGTVTREGLISESISNSAKTEEKKVGVRRPRTRIMPRYRRLLSKI